MWQYLTWTNIAIYVLVHYLTLQLAFFMSRREYNQCRKLEEKYAPFGRSDYHHWSAIKGFPCMLNSVKSIGYLFFWPRLIIFTIFLATVITVQW